MADALAGRKAERERLLAAARSFASELSERVPLVASVVAGSVARGDFNVWSDLDLVVICERLPERAPERSALLGERAPAGFQVVGYTPAEFRSAFAKGNRLVREAVGTGVVLSGAPFLRSVGDQPPG